MTASRGVSRSSRGLGSVALYYLLLAVVVVLLVRYVPAVRDAVTGSRLQELAGEDPFAGTPAVGSSVGTGAQGDPVLATMSMLGALAIMIPVTWIYMVTRRHRGYDESVIHTLLILPVAVAGIIMIVQDNLALAFSLAGVVAAVRFRTTLEDTKDAVYVFLAIGVGIASGVQALGLAFVLSVIFNGIILVLWQARFGNIYADQKTRAGPMSLGDVLAGPGSGAGALQVGDPAILDAASPADLAEVAERAVRMERYISEERSKKKTKRANALVLVHASAAESAQAYVEELLEELAARWRLAEIVPGPDGGSVLEYLARLDGPAVEGAVVDRLREAPGGVVRAAEVRSLKGLKKRV